MIDKEKVRELLNLVATSVISGKETEKLTTEWLEQNQPVIGFSDDYTGYESDLVIRALKDQTFTQPEVKEVPVGLSDEQVILLGEVIRSKPHKSSTFTIREWLKTQTFSHYNNEGKVYELDGSVSDYKADYESVAAGFGSLEDEYSHLKKEHNLLEDTHAHLKAAYDVLKLQQRPKPTHQVEVGQVWKCFKNGLHYEISSVGKLKSETSGDWDDSVNYICVAMDGTVMNENPYTRTLSDFLAKFKQVQP
jgi:hypothetical protein